MTKKMQEEMRVREAIRLLEEDAIQMERWADENLLGGYSTNQVRPMKKRAQSLRSWIGFLREKQFQF